jgi:hypothetical protein
MGQLTFTTWRARAEREDAYTERPLASGAEGVLESLSDALQVLPNRFNPRLEAESTFHTRGPIPMRV